MTVPSKTKIVKLVNPAPIKIRHPVLTQENIKSIRPGYEMHPKYLKNILGKKATKDYEFGERFSW